MPTSKNIESLIKYVANNDLPSFQMEVQKIIAEERQKKFIHSAERLESVLKQILKHNTIDFVTEKQISDFLIEIKANRALDTLILNKKVRSVCNQIIEEQSRATLLHSYGIEPNHRILLYGASGNGKTSLAEILATMLSLPLFVVRYETLIDSLLGNTSKGIKEIFDFVKTRKCVLFFDELDIIAKDRGNKGESGEIKRVLSSLLMQIDQLPSYVVFITATNYEALLDLALDRRFQVKIKLSKPNQKQIEEYIKTFQQNNDFQFQYQTILPKFKGWSFARVEQFCVDVFKKSILQNKVDNPTDIIHYYISML